MSSVTGRIRPLYVLRALTEIRVLVNMLPVAKVFNEHDQATTTPSDLVDFCPELSFFQIFQLNE
jgi:hypothetical protein